MLSSLLPSDNKSSGRNRTNNSKYVLEVPRGFSVHVFKTPSPPAYAQPGAAKTDYSSRTPSSTGRKQSDYPSPSRPDPSRKPSFGRANDYFGEQTEEYDRSLELTRTKSHKPYSIYPGAIPDSYIYERSIASVSDLPGSPSSSESSSDTESLDTPIEASSIRARCSVETLEATLYDTQNSQVAPLSTSPYGSSYITGPSAGRQLVVPPPTTSPLRYPPADDDESTVVSEDEQVTRLVQSPPLGYPPVVPITTPLVIPPPVRRNSDDRSSRSQAPTLTRRDSTQPTSRTSSPPGGVVPGEVAIRLPPGLQHVTAPAPVSRSTSRRPSTTTPPVTPPTSTGRSPKSERPPLSRSRSTSPAEAPAKSVRWHEDLISPSLPPPGERRKGWFNRRGDQLWTNDGRYKSPEPGQEYPPDLACYPETNCGWMNEDGVRIDMQHRLVPKPPLRSALKRSKNSSSSVEQVSIS